MRRRHWGLLLRVSNELGDAQSCCAWSALGCVDCDCLTAKVEKRAKRAEQNIEVSFLIVNLSASQSTHKFAGARRR